MDMAPAIVGIEQELPVNSIVAVLGMKNHHFSEYVQVFNCVVLQNDVVAIANGILLVFECFASSLDRAGGNQRVNGIMRSILNVDDAGKINRCADTGIGFKDRAAVEGDDFQKSCDKQAFQRSIHLFISLHLLL